MNGTKHSLRLTIANITLSDLSLVLVFNCLMFSVPLGEAFSLASYIDEACSVLFFILGLLSARRRILNNWERLSLVLITLLFVVGITGNFVYAIQPAANAIITDVIACTKFFMMLFGGYLFFSNRDLKVVFQIIEEEAKLLAVLFVFLALANLVFDSPMRSTGRFNIPAFQGVWTHPTYLVVSFVALLSILSTNLYKNWIYILYILIIIASSLRSKGLAIIGVYICLALILNRDGKLKLYHIVLISACAIYIGWDAMLNYYGGAAQDGGYARYMLQDKSMTIADDMFPWGAGFGTYGSNAAGKYYSALYYKYGLSDVWGLAPTDYLSDHSFLSDTFWPIVIGEFGWIGLILFIAIVICICLGARRRITSKGQSLGILIPLAYLLIASTSESAFFNTYAPFLAFCIAAHGSTKPVPPLHERRCQVATPSSLLTPRS